MVTLCDLGIGMSFLVQESKITVENVAETVKEIDDVSLTPIAFEEYKEISLEFSSKCKYDRLYFDGIELLPAELCEVDEDGNLYLKPRADGTSYPIFKYPSKYASESATEYYPMRVGRFEIRIWHENKLYFQCFRVLPKNINSDEWTIMQKELEDELQGLSSDMIRKNISIGENSVEILPTEDLYRFFVLKKYFHTILAALIDLKEKPNYRVEKEYHLQSLSHAAYIDAVTIRDYLKKGDGEEKYLMPKSIYNYDLPENRWLKKIITMYEKELRHFMESVVRYTQYLKREIQELDSYANKNLGMIRAKEVSLAEMEKYLDTAKNILYVSQLIKTQNWYQQIKDIDSLVLPHVLIYDVRYNVFYKIYKELQKENRNVEWNESYSYSWKLSDKMYEIWCFIKICRFLISDELGFEAKGWIFDAYKQEHVLVPELISGTKVEFTYKGSKKKDSYLPYGETFKIKLYYNKNVPRKLEATNEVEEPLFLREREGRRYSKPDIRMDLYKNDVYWSSLVFEVKYRTINNFWSSQNFSCKEQIRSYKNDLKSKFCRGLDSDFVIRKVDPVDRVWVLHPTHDVKFVIDKKNEGIKFVQLIPARDYEEVIKELKKEINEAFDGELV